MVTSRAKVAGRHAILDIGERQDVLEMLDLALSVGYCQTQHKQGWEAVCLPGTERSKWTWHEACQHGRAEVARTAAVRLLLGCLVRGWSQICIEKTRRTGVSSHVNFAVAHVWDLLWVVCVQKVLQAPLLFQCGIPERSMCLRKTLRETSRKEPRHLVIVLDLCSSA